MIDLNKKPPRLPTIPPSAIIRLKLDETLKQAEMLRILLRLASDLEAVDKREVLSDD